MSTTIDNKVVQMEFDNSRFERNVQTSLSTLEKLKQSLNLTGATKGFENIDSASRKINFDALSSGVEAVKLKFSALEVFCITALTRLSNSAINAGKRITSALTIDPIKTGFQEYETQINAVQTILANTSSKGTTLKDVNKALDELNTYADKTIYNFTEMTRNIGTFTAAGVDLDTSTKSIQGIANLAAVSGSTSQQASTAMYQLSQALAAGSVKLQDWNSVVNAGMGGQVFQDALKRTATAMGTNVDAMIKKYGSFRESLSKGEWLTTEVLTKTLEQFTMSAKEGSDEWNAFKKSLMDEGYTEKQATEILKMANTATDAATKVKTFTQLWDTLKEAAQSGWTQTWEILVGDFEEAKEMLTNVSNVVNEMIGKSAQARNELLQGWKDAGGRTDVLEGFKSIFNGLMAMITPVKEAFSDIFPAMEVDDLVGITKGFRELAKSFETFADKHGDQIYSTFKGIFSVLDVGWTIVKKLTGGIVELVSHFAGVGGGVLDITAAIGDFLTNISKTVKESDILGESINFIVDILTGAIDKVKEFGSSLKEGFKADGYEGFVGFLKASWEFVSKIGSGLTKAFSGLGKAIADVFGKNSFGDVLESGGLAALSVGLYKLVGNLNKPFDSISDVFEGLTGKDGILENVTGILDDVRGCFEAYQQQLKAGTLIKIASAIGILAASIFVISTIDPVALGNSLGAITILFGELLGSLAIFTQIMPNIKGVMKAVPLLLGMASAMLILSAALKIIGSMSPEQMITGLIGIAGGLTALVTAVNFMPKGMLFTGAAKSIRTLSISLVILAAALKIMGSMSWGELGRGLTGMAVGLTAMVTAVNLLPKSTGLRAAGMIGLAASLVILGHAIKTMGSMDWNEIGRGLSALAGSLGAIVVALRLMPKNMISSGLGLIAVSTALTILGSALKGMGSMSWGEIGKGLAVLGVALLELSIGLLAMRSSVSGAAALLIAAGALAIIAPTLKSLGEMSGGSIAKSLLALAGAFTVIGVAGYLLAPLIPTLLGLAGTFALFGVAALAFGAGLTLIGVGIGSIAGALAAGATSIIASITVIITGLLDLIPTVVTKLGEVIKAFALVIGDCAPVIADSLLKLVSEILKSLVTYIPQIADSLFELLIGVLDVLAARMPELIVAAVKVISGFFKGVVDALGSIDTKTMFEGILAVGLMAGLMFALSAVVGTIPGAMVGVLGMGVVIAELALVLAAIGGLAQIPGLSWLIGEGGDLLEKIGTALGQFIGGLAGGIASGFTSSLPDIATDLSKFMTNVQPFVDGAKNIDASLFDGVTAMAKALVVLTAADFISSLASFVTGGSSLSDFGKQLVPFGLSMKLYGMAVAGVDSGAIMASATAAKALATVADAIPKSGGLAGLFAGDSDLTTFAQQLVPFGMGLRGYASAVAGIDAQAIVGSAQAAKALAEMANIVPNEGGMAAWFTGENSLANFGSELVSLGMGLNGFAIVTAGIAPEGIIGAANAAKSIAEMMNTIPNEGGLVAWITGENSVAKFSNDLMLLGFGLKGFSIATTGIAPEGIIGAASAAKSIAEMMNTIPNEGGLVAWITGENSVAKFANQLPLLGSGLQMFSTATAGIIPENITAAANAAKSLAQMAEVIPNEGGINAWFAGENSVSRFANQLPLLGAGLALFSMSVAGINAENITSAANAAKSLAQMANVIPNEGGVKAWFAGENSIASFGDKLPALGEGLKGFSDSVADINAENITAASKAAKNLAQMANTAPKNTSNLGTFGANLVTFGDKLKKYFDNTKDISSENISTSTSAIKSIKTATTGLDSSSISSASTAIDSLVKSLKSMSSVSEKSVSGCINALKKLGESNVKSVVTAFNNAGPQLLTAGKNAISKLTEGVKSQDGKMKTAGQNSAKKLAEGISSQTSSVNTACRKVVSGCSDAIKSSRDNFYNAGSYLVQGFANGISANTWRAEAKATAMANAAERAAQEALDEHSPSRVFYKIGDYAGLGFVNALRDYASIAYNSSYDMADSARNGLGEAMSRVADVFNSDVDSQPTITPVVDLSNVQTGVGAINSMFGNGRTLGVSTNVSGISSAMNHYNQNGNSDVISAIDRLRKSMSNLGNTTYNVNGVTYDDGTNVSNAVSEIVRYAQIERRV